MRGWNPNRKQRIKTFEKFIKHFHSEPELLQFSISEVIVNICSPSLDNPARVSVEFSGSENSKFSIRAIIMGFEVSLCSQLSGCVSNYFNKVFSDSWEQRWPFDILCLMLSESLERGTVVEKNCAMIISMWTYMKIKPYWKFSWDKSVSEQC